MRQPRSRMFVEILEDRTVPSTFYVAPTGNDGGNGATGSPWRTLQKAASSVAAGDTVIVRAGTYAGFDLWTDGTASLPITFKADPGVLINAPNQRTGDGINLEGADWIVIDGFELNGLPRSGIRSVVNQHVTIRNNKADSNGRWGIFSGHSYDLTIENNVTSRSVAEHGIYVSNSGDRPVIRGNVSWGNRACGIHMNGDVSQGGDGIISNALVERNVIHGNGAGGGSGINADGVQNSRFQNNLLYNNSASGISLYQIDGGDGSKNNVVVNNTILVASNGRWGLNVRDGSTGNTVYNNVFYNYGSYRGSMSVDADCLAGFVSDYNVVMDRFTTNDGDSVMNLATWRSTTGQDSHSIVATPAVLFVNATGNDYHLATASPAIDLGTATQAPAVDLESKPRPSGLRHDVGAYELQTTSGGGDGSTVGLEDDAWYPGRKALVVRGTANDDVVSFDSKSNGTAVAVVLNGVNRGQWATKNFTRLIAYGLAGNDQITIASTLSVRGQFVGGDGNDVLTGVRGHDLLLGGQGQDQLNGNAGMDLLIGGEDADTLRGHDGSDLLISGTTTHASSDAALFAITQEWTSSRSYSQRTQRLAAGTSGLPKLNATTVFDDGVIDSLLGGTSNDWFFVNVAQDTLDRQGSERVN